MAETRLRAFDMAGLLRVRCTPAPPLDARVAACLKLLRGFPAQRLGREAAAQQALLSPSRFNHLFRQEMGVSFRSYRTWSQLRLAMLGLDARADLTQAALDGGFSDSAHFSRAFRGAFAMTPSSVLKPVAQVTRL
jgi:AraC-like DNA-binding protein